MNRRSFLTHVSAAAAVIPAAMFGIGSMEAAPGHSTDIQVSRFCDARTGNRHFVVRRWHRDNGKSWKEGFIVKMDEYSLLCIMDKGGRVAVLDAMKTIKRNAIDRFEEFAQFIPLGGMPITVGMENFIAPVLRIEFT